VITQFKKKPSAACCKKSLAHQALTYRRVTRGATCPDAGYPLVFGISVCARLESAQVAKTGVVPMPASSETPPGGHAAVRAL